MAKLTVKDLMNIDRDKVAAVPTKEIVARKLSDIIGQKSTITIKALPGDDYMEIVGAARNKKNGIDSSKMYKAQALVVVEGVVEPSLKDAELQKHFGCASALDLAKFLFPGGELVEVFNEIATLSRFIEEDEDDETVEDEVKN